MFVIFTLSTSDEVISENLETWEVPQQFMIPLMDLLAKFNYLKEFLCAS